MAQASGNADHHFGNWTAEAAEALGWAASQLPDGVTFTIEELRPVCAEQGLPDPPSLRAWGPASILARKQGYIEMTDQIGRSACANLARVPLYVKGRWP